MSYDMSIFFLLIFFTGTLLCKSCNVYLSAVQSGDKDYRIQLIGRHLKSATHKKHTGSDERGNDLIITKKESEYILRLQLLFVAKTNQKMDIFG